MDGWTRRELGLVGTASALVFSRVFGLSVVLPNFRENYADLASPVWIGAAFGAYGLTMALMQLPSGWISDKVGRKPMLLLASLLFIAGSLLAAYSDSIQTLIAGRLLQGMGAISSVAMAAVGETLPNERRTAGMAMIGIPAGIGFLAGIVAGPGLYPVLGMKGLFLLSAAVGTLAILPGLFLRFDKPLHVEPSSIPWRPVIALAFAGFVSNYALTTTLFHLPTTNVRLLAPMLVFAFLVVGVASRRIDKSGWTFGPVMIGVVLVPVFGALFATVSWGVLLFGAAFFASHSVLQSTLPSQVSRVAGVSGGRGHGIQNVIAYMGTFAAGPIAGALLPWNGAAFLVLLALGFVAVAVLRQARPQS